MTDAPALFEFEVGRTAAVRLRVLDKEQQRVSGHVEEVYWQEFGYAPLHPAATVDFVGVGGTWGQTELQRGELAITFLHHATGERLYEAFQHVRIEMIDGQWFAVHFYELGRARGVPGYLLQSAQPYAAGTAYVRTPLVLFEEHLREIARRVKNKRQAG
jgi:hypothetical protein